MNTNYLSWTGTEPVRFLSRRNTGTIQKDVRIALRQAVTVAESQAAGVTLTGRETTWNLPVALIAPLEPLPGDAVVDATGVVWAVTGPIQQLGRGSRWRMLCVRER